jgi:hypothetical protein
MPKTAALFVLKSIVPRLRKRGKKGLVRGSVSQFVP